jgi:hypothetical protein
VGDRTYIWYGSWNLTASGTEKVDLEQDMLNSHGDIGLLTVPRDRFGYVSVIDPSTAKERETFRSGRGSLLSAPFRVNGAPARVFMNVDISGGGKLAVELLDQGGMPIAGYSSSRFSPPAQSGFRVPVVWQDRNAVPAGGPYRLRVSFDCLGQQSPKLYAVYVTVANGQR